MSFITCFAYIFICQPYTVPIMLHGHLMEMFLLTACRLPDTICPVLRDPRRAQGRQEVDQRRAEDDTEVPVL